MSVGKYFVFMETSWCRVFAVFVLLSQFLASEARANSWEEAIAEVSKRAEQYHEYAVEVGGTSWAGTMYNGYKSVEHQCSILGRMLGHVKAIQHLEEFEYPPMDARSDPHDLLVFAISLRNWVASAQWAKEASRDQRINRWNLDCVGQFNISSRLFMEAENPNADFEVDGQQLHVYGDIDSGFSERFAAVLEANPTVTEVTLGSGGGSVRDALIAGSLIRQRGLNTTIYGNCYSACPLVFAGGTRRVVWAAPYRLGFHQIYTGEGEAIPLDDPLYGLVSRYLAEMGISPRHVLAWMFSAGPSEMHEPEPQRLCDALFATFVQRICGIDMSR
jgi:hypothetical protein